MAACKTKPFELLDIDSQETLNPPNSQSKDKKKKIVMLEDGLGDGEDLFDTEKETRQYAMKMIDGEADNARAHYLKVVNHMYFSDYSIYTVELPVSMHGTPEG